MSIKLPKIIKVRDYHEFDTIQEVLDDFSGTINVREIGFDGDYVGVAYQGRWRDAKKSPAVRSAFQAIKIFNEGGI